jgi:AcrR family transcriptional regulator
VTLEVVAEAAGCSVQSLYAVFGTRDVLFGAIYEQHSPFRDLVNLSAQPDADLRQIVADIHRAVATSLTREPQVGPAMLADVISNPNGSMAAVMAHYFPLAMSRLGGWLAAQVAAGRIRDIPVPLLVQMLLGPVWAHLVMRRAMSTQEGWEVPPLDQVCSEFTATFLRAVAVPAPNG